MPELTPRQALFVREYAGGKSAKEAAVAAGYREANADSQGSNLIRTPHIAEAIERERSRVTNAALARSVYSVEGQLEKLEAIYTLAMADEQYSTAVKVIGEQNKMLGFLAPERKDVNVTGEITHRVEHVSETDRWLEGIAVGSSEVSDAEFSLQ